MADGGCQFLCKFFDGFTECAVHQNVQTRTIAQPRNVGDVERLRKCPLRVLSKEHAAFLDRRNRSIRGLSGVRFRLLNELLELRDARERLGSPRLQRLRVKRQHLQIALHTLHRVRRCLFDLIARALQACTARISNE